MWRYSSFSLTVPHFYVSDSSSSNPFDDGSSDDKETLYDATSWSNDLASSLDEETTGDTVKLRLSLPEDYLQRLMDVAQQLGLPPTMVAKRAIEMICDEVETTQDEHRPPHVLLKQYQARIDLLHAVKEADPDTDETYASDASPDANEGDPSDGTDADTTDDP